MICLLFNFCILRTMSTIFCALKAFIIPLKLSEYEMAYFNRLIDKHGLLLIICYTRYNTKRCVSKLFRWISLPKPERLDSHFNSLEITRSN